MSAHFSPGCAQTQVPLHDRRRGIHHRVGKTCAFCHRELAGLMEVRSAWCCGNARCLGMAFQLGDREKAA